MGDTNVRLPRCLYVLPCATSAATDGVPRYILGHISEEGRVIGFLLEKIADARHAAPADFEACSQALSNCTTSDTCMETSTSTTTYHRRWSNNGRF